MSAKYKVDHNNFLLLDSEGSLPHQYSFDRVFLPDSCK